MQKKLTHPLLIFITAIHVIYFFIALKTGNIYLVDSFGYLNQVKNILAHQSWYAEDWNSPVLIDYFTIRPPLYAFFIIGIKFIFNADYFVIIIQNLLSIFNFILLWKMLFDQHISQKNINLIIVGALIFYPSQMIHSNLIMTEILFQTLLMISFYFSVKMLTKPSYSYALIIALSLSLAMLTKPVILLFGFIIFIFFVIKFRTYSKKFLLPFILIPVTYHLLCLQNQHTTGYYHFSSIKVLADLRVNARYIISHKYGEDSSAKFCTKVFDDANAMPDYASHYRHIEQSCNTVYFKNISTYIFLYAKGIASTLIDPGRFDLSVFLGIQDYKTTGLLHRLNTEGIKVMPEILKNLPIFLLLYLLLILCWNILLCVSILTFVFNKKLDSRLRILVLLFIIYIVAATGISGLCRYRVPVYPEIIFVASFFIPKLVYLKIFQQKNA